MKRWIIITAATSCCCLIGLYLAIGAAASFGLLGEDPFGYYRDFNLVRSAIKATPCVKSSSYGRHEDIALEDFHFTVHTTSGRQVILWFHNYQDVNQICTNPQGLLIPSPRGLMWDQVYNIKTIADRLGVKDGKTVSLPDILCHIDELMPLFEANYNSDAVPRATWQQQYNTEEFRAFLRLEITAEGHDSGYKEIPTD